MPENKTGTTIIDISREGTLWWSIMVAISIISLGYIGIWGYFGQNIRAGFVVIIFGFLLTISLIALLSIFIIQFVKGKATGEENTNIDRTWRYPSLGFLIGFFIQLQIVAWSKSITTLSLFSIQQNSLFATIANQLPRMADFFLNAFMIPIIEELFWLFFIPQLVFIIFGLLAKRYKFFEIRIIPLIVAIVLSASTFAIFHVGKSNITFIITALVFRTILIILFWGDMVYNLIPFGTVLASTMVGIHVGNNWGDYGFMNGVSILTSNVWGFLLLGLFVIMVITSLDLFFDKAIRPLWAMMFGKSRG